MIPVIGTSATISPDWFKSVSNAVGGSALASDFRADNLVTETQRTGVRSVLQGDRRREGQGRQYR